MSVNAGWRVMRAYRRAWLSADLMAGCSVGVLAIPSVIAYAELAGLPPQSGLVTAVLGMLAYAFFGSSRQVIVGPDAAIALLIAAGVAPLAHGDPWRAAALASLLAIMVGVFLLLAALARLGAMADLLSKPILTGFMQGAALILIATQLAKLGRIDLHQTDFIFRVGEFLLAYASWHRPTFLTGMLLLLAFWVFRRFAPRWPAALTVFAGVIAIDYLVDLSRFGLSMVGPLPVPELGFAAPAMGLHELGLLLPAALGIVLLAMPEGILLARAFAERNHEESDANKELVGIGVASLLAGLLGGFALGASQSRTTLNDAVGAKSQLSGLIAALLVGFFLFFLTKLLNHLPAVAVAALLIHVGIYLLEPRALHRLFALDRAAGWFAVLTTAGVLIVGVVPGIMAGILLSLIRVVHSFSRPYDAMLCSVSGRSGYHDVGDVADAGVLCSMPGLLVYRFYAPLLFTNAHYFVERVRELVSRSSGVRWIVIDAQAMVETDVSAAEQLLAFHQEMRQQGIHLRFARCNRPLRESFARYGVVEALGDDHFYTHLDEAIDDFCVATGQPRPSDMH